MSTATKQPANPDGMLTKRDVCARLNIGEKALRRLVRSRKLRAYRYGKGRTSPLRFREMDVRSFLESACVNPSEALSANSGAGEWNGGVQC